MGIKDSIELRDRGCPFSFEIIDPKTGEYPDLEQIALTEDWAKNLVYCDMEGFCVNEDGNLILMDECGNYAYCPEERFMVTWHMESRDDKA